MSESDEPTAIDANNQPIRLGDIVQEKDAGFVGRVVAIDRKAILYRPHGRQECGTDTTVATVDEVVVLTEPAMPATCEPRQKPATLN